MDLEGIMPGEISQMKTNTVLFHLRVECKNKQTNKQNKIETDSYTHRTKYLLPERKGLGDG